MNMKLTGSQLKFIVSEIPKRPNDRGDHKVWRIVFPLEPQSITDRNEAPKVPTEPNGVTLIYDFRLDDWVLDI